MLGISDSVIGQLPIYSIVSRGL